MNFRNSILFFLCIFLFSSLVVSAWESKTADITSFRSDTKWQLSNIQNPTVRWYLSTVLSQANATLTQIANVLRNWNTHNTPAFIEHKKNLIKSYREYVATVLSSNNTIPLRNSEKLQVEQGIVSLQKGFIHTFKQYLDRFQTQDYMQSGNMHFEFTGKDFGGVFSIAPHTSIASVLANSQKLTMDMSFSGFLKKDTDIISGHASVRLDIAIFSWEVFLQLSSFTGVYSDSGVMNMISWAIFPYLDTQWRIPFPAGYNSMSSNDSIQMVQKLLTLLESEPLFTPYLRAGSGYVLTIKKETVNTIARLLLLPPPSKLEWKRTEKDILKSRLQYQNGSIVLPGFDYDATYMFRAYTYNATMTQMSFIWNDLEASFSVLFSPELCKIDITDEKNTTSFHLTSDVWTRLEMLYTQSGSILLKWSVVPENTPGTWKYNFEGTLPYYDVMMKIYGDISEEWGQFSIVRPEIYKEIDGKFIPPMIPFETMIP